MPRRPIFGVEEPIRFICEIDVCSNAWLSNWVEKSVTWYVVICLEHCHLQHKCHTIGFRKVTVK